MDRSKSLNELEGTEWGEPPFPSSLVVRCHELRRRPLCEMSLEDLRLLIGQQIGLPFLMPLALEALELDPLAQGDYYPGDLLRMVLTVEDRFWADHPKLQERLADVLAQFDVTRHSIDEHLQPVADTYKRRHGWTD